MSGKNEYKICGGKNGCGTELLYDDFGIDKRNKSGRKTICKECEKKYKNKKYLENKEKTYYIAYRNSLEEDPVYTILTSKDKSLTSVCYEFARTCGSDELYNAIIRDKIAVEVNEDFVEIDDWHKDILKDGDKICIIPEVGVSAIASVIAGYIVSALSAAGLSVGLTTLSVIYNIVTIALYAIVTIGLSFISNALFAPDTPDMSFSSGKSTQTYNWSGINTVARIHSPIPVVYGTRKLGGNIISVYTESQNNGTKNYVNILLSLCEGEIEGICRLDNINEVCQTSNKLNPNYTTPHIYLEDQPINYYNNVEWWYRTGTNTATYNLSNYSASVTYNKYDVVASNGAVWECQVNNLTASPIKYNSNGWTKTFDYPFSQTLIPHFTDAAIQNDDGRTINTSWVTYNTIKKVDKVVIQIYAPSMYETNDDGLEWNYASYRIQYKPVDGSVWYDLTDNYNLYSPRVYKRTGGSGSDDFSIFENFSGEENIDEIYNLLDIPTYYQIFADPIGVTYCDGKPTHTYNEKIESCYVEVCSNNFEETYYTALGGVWSDYYNAWVFGYTEEYHIPIFDIPTNREVDIYYTISANIYDENLNFIKTVTYINQFIRSYFAEIKMWVNTETQESKPIGNNTYSLLLGRSNKINDFYKIVSELSVSPDIFYIHGMSKSGIFTNHEIDFNTIFGGRGKDLYSIRLIRTDGGTTYNMGDSNNIILQSVTEIVYGDFTYPNTSLLGLRILADEQLSGQPPNINVLVKGNKVEVPALSGTEEFQDIFWNNTENRWENTNASVRTWDEESWQSNQSEKEFTDNFALVIRDLLTNTRYGLGKYITTDNLYNEGFISAIKECHKKYNVEETSGDYFEWWNVMEGNLWETYIDYFGDFNTNAEINLDSTNKNISINTRNSSRNRDNSIAFIDISLLETLSRNKNYVLNASIVNVTDTLDTLHTYINNEDGTFKLVNTSNNIGNGNLSIDFTSNSNKSDTIRMSFIRDESATLMSATLCTISNMTLNWSGEYDHYHTFDGVFDSNQSALSAILEICEGYRSWPVWIEGGITLVMDTDTTPIHTLSMNNMIEFTQAFTSLSEIPSKVTGQFCNESNDYDMAEIIKKSSDTSLNELNELILGFKGITNIKKAEREIIWKLNKITNCTHIINCKCGIDTFHAVAGDIINIQHDLPSWGHGGMIIDYNSVNASIIIDTEYNFTATNSTASYLIKYQKSNNNFVTATIDVVATGSTQQLSVRNWVGTPCKDSSFALGNSNNYVKPFRVIKTARETSNEIDIVLVEHVPALYDSEPTLEYKDVKNYSSLPNEKAIPKEPVNCKVLQTQIGEGVGFKLSAEFPNTEVNIKEIVVEMCLGSIYQNSWETIAVLPKGSTSTTYINENLRIEPPNNVYNFRFYTQTIHKKSSYVLVPNITLDKTVYSISHPTGLHVKYSDPNDIDDDGRLRWDGNNLTLVWNPIGGIQENLVKNYKLEIYHDSDDSTNLLVTKYTSSTEYTYLQDAAPYYSHLVVKLYTVSKFNTESFYPVTKEFINTVPSTPTNVTASPLEDAVKFSWDMNTEEDLVGYRYQTRVNSNSWSNWKTVESNEFVRELTNYEVAAQGYGQSNISMRLKSLDKYSNVSATTNIASIDCLNYKPEIVVSPTPGLGHFTTIASAVNAASVNGGKILLKEGTHQLATALFLPKADYNIEGINKEIVIVKNASSYDGFVIEQVDDGFSPIRDNSYTFSNFTMQSTNSRNNQSNMIRVESEAFTAAELHGTLNFNNIIFNLSSVLATTLNSVDIAIKIGNTIFDLLYSDIFISNCEINKGMEGINIQNSNGNSCVIENNVLASQKWTGIVLGNPSNVTVRDNVISDFYRAGITLGYEYTTADYNLLIKDNKLTSNVNATSGETYIWGIVGGSKIKRASVRGNKINIISDRSDLTNVNAITIGDQYSIENSYVSENQIVVTASCSNYIYGISGALNTCNIINNTIVIDNFGQVSQVLSKNIGINFPGFVGCGNNLVSNNFLDLTNNTSSDFGVYISYNTGHYGGGNIIKDAGTGIYTDNGSHDISATYITS